MLSADEHPGIFTFLVGMIVVVMAAVGLSIMADKHRTFSSGAGALRREIAANAAEISELTARREEQGWQLKDSGGNLLQGSKTHGEVVTGLKTLRQRQAALEKSRLEISESITALESEFSLYRENYRRKTWEGAVGESLGNLTVKGGREFRQATITRVTDVGLEINHEHGIARIQAPDLDPKIQDRFQWSDEERRRHLKEELERQQGKSGTDEPAAGEEEAVVYEKAPETPAPQVKRVQPPRPAEDPEKLRLLRLHVSGWKAKVSKLRIDRSEASSRASYGNQSSVPGSLETWAARSARLGRELLQAEAALSAAKSKLAAVAPNDPLLRVLETDR